MAPHITEINNHQGQASCLGSEITQLRRDAAEIADMAARIPRLGHLAAIAARLHRFADTIESLSTFKPFDSSDQ